MRDLLRDTRKIKNPEGLSEQEIIKRNSRRINFARLVKILLMDFDGIKVINRHSDGTVFISSDVPGLALIKWEEILEKIRGNGRTARPQLRTGHDPNGGEYDFVACEYIHVLPEWVSPETQIHCDEYE